GPKVAGKPRVGRRHRGARRRSLLEATGRLSATEKT
ncbi:hypothetical protein TIFTF001_055651, partial [Ficus carica]